MRCLIRDPFEQAGGKDFNTVADLGYWVVAQDEDVGIEAADPGDEGGCTNESTISALCDFDLEEEGAS